MGTRGPVPVRSDQRRRTNSPEAQVVAVTTERTVPVPPADSEWHPVALAWYEALADSGQAIFYEPSDWATAYLVAESMHRDLGPQVVGTTESGQVIKDVIPLKGASLSAYLRAFSVLMVTEGDRRRAQLELERAQHSDPDADRAAGTVSDIRARLTGS